MLAIIAAILKLFGLGAAAAKTRKDESTGAALQRGAEAEAELSRLARASLARRKAPVSEKDPNDLDA